MAKDIPVPYFVYHAGDSEAEHSHPNVGNEAMGYLMFIAEYYDCLPEVSASRSLICTPAGMAKLDSVWQLLLCVGYAIRTPSQELLALCGRSG